MPKKKLKAAPGMSRDPEPLDDPTKGYEDIAREWFGVKLSGNIHVTKSGDTVEVIIFPFVDESLRPTIKASIPASVFKNDDQLRAWGTALSRRYKEIFAQTMFLECLPLLIEVGNQALITQGIVPLSLQNIVKARAEISADAARYRLGIKKTGRPGKWSTLSLTRAISQAFRALPPAKQNYDGVNIELQKHFPEKAPASGEALRQQVLRLKISWSELKRAAKSRKQSASFLQEEP
jgi:hypothetical protein